MKTPQHILIVTGSPIGSQTTSAAIGRYLGKKIEEYGLQSEQLNLKKVLTSDETWRQFLASLDSADVLALSCPLYVDGLPYEVTRAFELIAEHRTEQTATRKSKGLLAIVNGGFPEAHQSHVALEICRCFAQEAHFEWLGGLAKGGGSLIAGKPLESLGKQGRNLRNALQLAAEAIHQGIPVPEDAVRLIGKPPLPLPAWGFALMANWIMKKEARKHGTLKRIHDTPYA